MGIQASDNEGDNENDWLGQWFSLYDRLELELVWAYNITHSGNDSIWGSQRSVDY